MTKIQKLKIIILLSALFFILPRTSVLAAELFFNSKAQELGIGQEFRVDLFLSTENEELNAVEGNIVFFDELAVLKEIRDGNSIISFWVERPKAAENGKIIFSGITPGGYRGERGLLFSLIFQTKKDGQGIIEIRESRALLNDGKGTAASLSVSPYKLTISQQVPAKVESQLQDKNLPEAFMPEVARDSAIFDGKWFLVFVTQDKDSGIDHYEVQESHQRIFAFFSEWERAESPYILRDQELKSYLAIKVIDRAGNKRIIKIQPQNQLLWYENYENWLIMLITITVLLIAGKILWRKRHSK